MQYKLLEDSEIILSPVSDQLENRIYVDTLESIISSLEQSSIETIGLFGEWGTGKSSIIRTLEHQFNKKNTKIDGKKVDFVFYNAWKYSNDDFRKTFLISAAKLINEEKHYSNKLYSVTTEKKNRLNLNSWITVLIFFSFYFLSMLFLPKIPINFENYSDLISSSIQLINTLVTSAFMTYMLNSILKMLFFEESITSTKIFSPQDFSDFFRDIMSKNKNYTILVIDDIDRCNDDQMIEILETIHGFLQESENQKLNYSILLPLDKSKLDKTLQKVKTYDPVEQEQFYNKIFDVIIPVDSIADFDIYQMLSKINIDNNYKISNFSMTLLTDFKIKTPRDLARDINKLNIKRSIIEQKKKQGSISNTVLMNIDEITKYYLLKENWPEYYWEIISIFLKGGNIHDHINELINNSENELNKYFASFISRTRNLPWENIVHYEFLNDVEQTFDLEIIENILNSDNISLSSLEPEILTQYIEAFNFTFIKYINNQGLENHYIIALLNTYIQILTYSDIDQFKKLITYINLDTFENHLSMVPKENLQNININSIFDSKIDDQIYNDFIIGLYTFSLKNLNINFIIRAIFENEKRNFFDDSNVIIGFNMVLSNWSKKYDNSFSKIISHPEVDTLISQDDITNFIESESHDTLNALDNSTDSLLVDRYEEIIQHSKIVDLFRSSIDDEGKTLLDKLTYINNFHNNNFKIVLNNSLGNYSFRSFISSLQSLKLNDQKTILQEIFKLLISHNNILDNFSAFLTQIITNANESNSRFILEYISNNYPDNEMKMDYYLYLIFRFQDYDLIEEKLIPYLNHTIDDENLLSFEKQITTFRSSRYSNITINYKNLRESTSININVFKDRVLPTILLLEEKYLLKLLDLFSLDEILSYETLLENIKSLKKNVVIYRLLLNKVLNVNHYIILSDFISKSTHKSLFNSKLKDLLEKGISFTEVVQIHNLKTVDQSDLKKLKAYVLLNYPTSDRSSLTKIDWN